MKSIEHFAPYFQELNIDPAQNPSLKLLQELQKKHIENFPFSNIDVILKKPISLESEDIFKKIVLEKRGGYCFEHNQLIYEVLEALGFNISISIARVLNNQKIDIPRTHRITHVRLDNKLYLIDVSFGSMSPKEPLEIVHSSQNKKYQLSQKEQEFQLELKIDKKPFILYQFNLNHYTQADCVMGNFYSYCNPNAIFVNNIVISLQLPHVTLSYRNGSYHQISDNETKIKEIKTQSELYEMLKSDFNICLNHKELKKIFEFSQRGK